VIPRVVDASIAIKWLLPEIHSAAALRILEGRNELFAPDLIWAEAGNVLWKRVRSGAVSTDNAQALLRDLRRFPITTLPMGSLVESALEIAVSFGRTVYDSLYLTLALSRQCQLVTADRRLYNSLRRGPLAPTLLWVEDIP